MRIKREVLCADFDHLAPETLLWLQGDPENDGAPERDRVTETVRGALTTALTARQREVVEMHFFDGLSQGEIARRLGVSQQVVQKSLYGTVRRGRVVGGALPRLRQVLAPLVRP